MTKNILIISPHPDDDVIGMGGTIALKAKQGFDITIVYVTNGGGTIKAKEYEKLSAFQIITLRKEEAEKSLEPLLVKDSHAEQIFLGLDSPQLYSKPELFTNELQKILKQKSYSEIYMPYPGDRHETHKKVTELSLETIKALKIDAEVFAYETWDAIPVTDKTVFVDITPYYKNKLSAVSCHRSQCSITPFDEGIIAKNRYNAIFQQINSKNSIDYAEIFLKL